MHQRITGTLLTLAVLGGAAAHAAPSHPLPCNSGTEILSISPRATFAGIGRSDGAPVYEVKYRHCEQVHHVLIQLPGDEAETHEGRVEHIFF